MVFTADSQFSIKTANRSKNWDGTLYYSNEYYADNSMWSVWNGVDEIFSNKGIGEEKERIYIRGLGNSKITGGDSSSVARTRGWVLDANEKISCYGPIGTLNNYKTIYENGTGAKYQLAFLFYGAKKLKQPPRINFTPTNYCALEQMFNGSGIEEAPLCAPPTSASQGIADWAVCGLFLNCTELKSVSDMTKWLYCSENSFSNLYLGCSLIYVSKSAGNGYDKIFIGGMSDNGGGSVGKDAFSGTSGSYKSHLYASTKVFYYYTSNPVVRDIYNVKDRPYLTW